MNSQFANFDSKSRLAVVLRPPVLASAEEHSSSRSECAGGAAPAAVVVTPAATTSLSTPDLVHGSDGAGSDNDGDGDGDVCWQSPDAFGGDFDDDDDHLFGGERDSCTTGAGQEGTAHLERGFGEDDFQARTPSHEVAAIEAAKRELLQYESQPFTWYDESDDDGSAYRTTTD